MTLLAAHTTLWLVFGLTTGAVFAIVLAAVVLVFEAVAAGDPVTDVQRFIELTGRARLAVPRGRLALLDPDAAAAAVEAIPRFQEQKDAARRALWTSRPGRSATATVEGTAAAPEPSSREVHAAERAA